MKKLEVLFYPNGSTAVFKDNEQVPKLQKGWFLLFVEFLRKEGLDPTQINFILPDGKKAKVAKTSEGDYNRSIESVGHREGS